MAVPLPLATGWDARRARDGSWRPVLPPIAAPRDAAKRRAESLLPETASVLRVAATVAGFALTGYTIVVAALLAIMGTT
jgi:hypothetical protein